MSIRPSALVLWADAGVGVERQTNGEPGAATRFGLDLDITTVLIDNLVGDEEPEAGALDALG